MNFKALVSRVLILVCIVGATSISALADTVRLKDGSTVKGKITGFRGGKFTIVVGEGSRQREFTFEADEIEFIEFDRVSGAVPVEAINSKVSSEYRVISEEPTITEEKKIGAPMPAKPVSKPGSGLDPVKPIVLNVNVTADDTSNGWTNSGWVVRKGQKIRIIGEGEVSLGKGQRTGPSGSYSLEDDSKLLKSVPTGALIAVIGDDNNDFIYIGADREFVAARDGTLFLGLNEGNLKDNSGSFKVTIEISPDR